MRFKTCYRAVLPVLFFLAFTPLSKCQDMPGAPGWQRLDAIAFSVEAPEGWSFHQLAGADSYVGEFVGDGMRLRFDFGSHSDPLENEQVSTYVVVQKHIGGHRARVVFPRIPGHGTTGIFFPKTFDSNKLTMFTRDLDSKQQELALKIFETIRFGRTVPSVIPPPPRFNAQ